MRTQQTDTHLYFAYGSNLDRGSMAHRCPDSEPVGPATLEGWTLRFRGVADIEPRERGRVQGALWRISDRDRDRLDTYEGYPSLYGREKVVVRPREVRPAGELAAVTYVMREDDLALPSPSYLETIRRGYEQWGLPLIALDFAVAKVKDAFFDLGIHRFEPDGPKRLRPAP
jgi:gamma-glutamylcyclotransferase (GGCT)/AIG2-like uncharacterized protein YtfP